MNSGPQGARRRPEPGVGSTTVARCCHGVIVAVIAASLVIQLVLLFTGGADANSGRSDASLGIGVRLGRLISYFTIESNLIVLAVSLTLLVQPHRDGPIWRVVRLDSLLGIVVTGLVFAIVLAPQVHLTGWALAATIGFHYISPWATLIVWFVFGPRPRISWRTVAWAFAWPLVWIGYTFVHGAITGWYPYPFLDAKTNGYGSALTSAALVLIIGGGLAVAFKLLDRLPTVDSEPELVAADKGGRAGSP